MNQKEIEDAWKSDWGTEFNSYGHKYEWRVEFIQRAFAKLEQMGVHAKTVLDIGCATGLSFPVFEKMSLKPSGLEINKPSVDECRRCGYDVVEGNVLALPFDDESFDVVYCWGTLTHITPPNIKKAVDEMCRVAKYAVVAFERNAVSKVPPTDYDGHKEWLYTHNLIKLFCENPRVTFKPNPVQAYAQQVSIIKHL